MNHTDKIREKWARGELCVGTSAFFSDAAVSELFGVAGFDFIWIDLEHSAMGVTEAADHVRAAYASGAAPWIRVPSNDPTLIKPILELHPSGVIVPRIESPEDAEAAVQSCRYPPRGVRGFGPYRGMRYGDRSVEDYLSKVDDEILVILQIEHINAVNKIEEVLDVPGIDSVVIGPMDLSGSMNKLGNPSDPEVMAAMERIYTVAREKGIPSGQSIGYDRESVRHWLGMGLSWIAMDGDFITLFKHSKRMLEDVREMGAAR
jgi:2-keto-3-deoxy-L-rhamnonate aldolase RhmA